MSEDAWKKLSDLPGNPFLPAGSVSGSSPRRTAASGQQRSATQTPRLGAALAARANLWLLTAPEKAPAAKLVKKLA